MASIYTGLGIELRSTGENAGTWGTKTNTNLQIIEQISGGHPKTDPRASQPQAETKVDRHRKGPHADPHPSGQSG